MEATRKRCNICGRDIVTGHWRKHLKSHARKGDTTAVLHLRFSEYKNRQRQETESVTPLAVPNQLQPRGKAEDPVALMDDAMSRFAGIRSEKAPTGEDIEARAVFLSGLFHQYLGKVWEKVNDRGERVVLDQWDIGHEEFDEFVYGLIKGARSLNKTLQKLRKLNARRAETDRTPTECGGVSKTNA